MIRAISPAGSSIASSTLDDVCGLDDDQMSSLGETLANNATDGGPVNDPFDAQFLRQVAELNRQMSTQLEGLARSVEKARMQHFDPIPVNNGMSSIVPDPVRDLLLHSPTQASGQTPKRQQQNKKHLGKRYKAQRRPTVELLTSDDEANEYTGQRSSSYLEPQARQTRQAEEPNHRSSFETLYGFVGSSEISADWYDDQPEGLLTWPDGMQQKQDRIGKLNQEQRNQAKTQSEETLLQLRKAQEQKTPRQQHQQAQIRQNHDQQRHKKLHLHSPQDQQQTALKQQNNLLQQEQQDRQDIHNQEPIKEQQVQLQQPISRHRIQPQPQLSTAFIHVPHTKASHAEKSAGIPETRIISSESSNQFRIGAPQLATGLPEDSKSVQLHMTPNYLGAVPVSTVPTGTVRNTSPRIENNTAGSEANKRREQKKCRLNSRRNLQSHQNQNHQSSPLSENHVSRVNFLVASSAHYPVAADGSPQEATQAFTPQRLTRAVRFRSGSFSDFNYYYPAPRQQLSNLEIGILRQCPPPPLWPVDCDLAAATHFVVTEMRRVDYSDPVSELELMCRAMRLNDADLMEGAARRDTNAVSSFDPVGLSGPRRWSSSGHHQQRGYRRQHLAMSRPVKWPDPVRDDQAKRRVAQQQISGPTVAQQLHLPSFIGRASDGERARQQGWWIRAKKRPGANFWEKF